MTDHDDTNDAPNEDSWERESLDSDDYEDGWTPPHPEDQLVHSAVDTLLAQFAATVEPNWMDVMVSSYSPSLPDGAQLSVHIHGPLHGLTDVSLQLPEILGEWYEKYLAVVFHSICGYGHRVLNPAHRIEFVEGRTQMKLRDPRPRSLEQRREVYEDHMRHDRGNFLGQRVWDEPYSAVTVNVRQDNGWIDLLVIDEHDHPTGEVIRCHGSELREALTQRPYYSHPRISLAMGRTVLYRATAVHVP